MAILTAAVRWSSQRAGGRSARVVLVSCQLAILEKWTNRIGPHWRFASVSPNGREEREIERRCSLPLGETRDAKHRQ
jgi:hypothetical protein